MGKVNIRNHDLGFWTEEPITVQIIDWHKDEEEPYKDVLWCNHARAEEEEVHNEIPVVDGQDISWTDKVLVCMKCGAYRLPGNEYWENAPFEGVTK